jgi:hypothetical protein
VLVSRTTVESNLPGWVVEGTWSRNTTCPSGVTATSVSPRESVPGTSVMPSPPPNPVVSRWAEVVAVPGTTRATTFPVLPAYTPASTMLPSSGWTATARASSFATRGG